jgi:hypothetical protein
VGSLTSLIPIGLQGLLRELLYVQNKTEINNKPKVTKQNNETSALPPVRPTLFFSNRALQKKIVKMKDVYPGWISQRKLVIGLF